MGKSVTNEIDVPNVTIKKEIVDEDHQDLTESTMNELLGWYGYENSRDTIKTEQNCKPYLDMNNSEMESPKSSGNCGWCDKPIEKTTGIASASTNFCSELCFSHSRRANFKKNKTCDWCRHVRHTISHVDFQDGISQLQFCSDKCLNQYKMHIFCRETRAHLELYPHLPVEPTSSGNLITPDLWLKNCKSTELRTPSPKSPMNQYEKPPQTSPISLISATHPLNIKETIDGNKNKFKSRKKPKKISPSTTITHNSFKYLSDDIPQDLRIRQSPVEIPASSFKYLDNEKTKSNFKPSPPTNTRVLTPQQVNCPGVSNPELPNMTRLYDSILPPPTIIVPYPIFLPIPIPIPIPLPIPLNNNRSVKEQKECSVQTEPAEWNNYEPEDNNDSNTKTSSVLGNGRKVESKKVGRMLRKRKRICEPRVATLKTRRKN